MKKNLSSCADCSDETSILTQVSTGPEVIFLCKDRTFNENTFSSLVFDGEIWACCMYSHLVSISLRSFQYMESCSSSSIWLPIEFMRLDLL